jgi:glycosyltransferase involved in cell wall biosynthesis
VTAVAQFAQPLMRAGWDLRFLVVRNKSRVIDMLEASGLEVDRCEPGRFGRHRVVRNLLIKSATAVVHTHNPSAQLTATLAARKLPRDVNRLRVVRTVHADMFEEMKGSLPAWKIAFWRRVTAWAMHRTDAITVVSPHLIPLLPLPDGFDRSVVRVLTNGFDPMTIESDNASLPDEVAQFLKRDDTASGASPVVVTFGRLVYVKNYAMLFRAFAHVIESIPHAKLILAGSGPLESELRQLRDDLGLTESILMLPWIDRVAPLVKRANVVAISSHSECCPMLVLEAMSASKPVVATAVGGIPSMLQDDETAVLVPAGDESGLAEGINRMLSSPEQAVRIGEAGRRDLERRYHPRIAAQQIANVYNDVLSE